MFLGFVPLILFIFVGFFALFFVKNRYSKTKEFKFTFFLFSFPLPFSYLFPKKKKKKSYQDIKVEDSRFFPSNVSDWAFDSANTVISEKNPYSVKIIGCKIVRGEEEEEVGGAEGGMVEVLSAKERTEGEGEEEEGEKSFFSILRKKRRVIYTIQVSYGISKWSIGR